MKEFLSVREMEVPDIDLIINYWQMADEAYLHSMGADINKLPAPSAFKQMLAQQLSLPLEKKRAYCLLWLLDGVAVGHCNTNPTSFGEEACLHLHIWRAGLRHKGLGMPFLKMSVSHFFEKLLLKKLYSEPYALNSAPNKILEKLGFNLEQEYTTTPGAINFEQPVKRWSLTADKFEDVHTSW